MDVLQCNQHLLSGSTQLLQPGPLPSCKTRPNQQRLASDNFPSLHVSSGVGESCRRWLPNSRLQDNYLGGILKCRFQGSSNNHFGHWVWGDPGICI